MKLRYVGDSEERDLALPGGFIPFKRMKWLDPHKAAEDAGIRPDHLDVILPALAAQPDWELDDSGTRVARKVLRQEAETQEDDQ